MNKDKRIVVKVLADLCGAYSTQRHVPQKVLLIIRDAVKDLAESEQRSLKKMEPYKENAGTAVNYRNSLACWEDLVAAQDALEEGEFEEAYPLLLDVATPPEPERAEPEPVGRRRKGRRS